MRQQLLALQAEVIKIKSAKILWATFIAFAIVPVMGGVFILVVQDNEAMEKASGFALKIKAMNFEANWKSYLNVLSQAVGVGGVLLFGFVASWIFGREYSDGTAKDLLSLPTSRTKIVNAKFILYVLWCLMLVLSNLVVAFILGTTLHLPTMDTSSLTGILNDYFITTALTIIAGVPIAFFALYGKGYLAPLSFVALTLVFSQVIAAIGYGSYFPWSIPGLYSGAGGEYKNLLSSFSYIILLLTGIVGYLATTIYWKNADQTK
ncbi:MAG: ABC transporter permease [Chitinophagaceae bacterium]|nr:ABC transporter permease [Chitinophagaceae bacterium]MCW5926999.1 ABC transporter permease [Chitinophagaceae bacterium]